MQPGYEIEVDRPRGLLRYKLLGRLNDEIALAFGRDREVAVASLRLPPNSHLAFYDIVSLQLPTQEEFAAIQRFIGDPGTMSRRAAVLTTSGIQRLQVRRMSSHRDVGFFTDRAQAESWLLADDASAAASGALTPTTSP